MNSQLTAPEVIDKERGVVAGLTGSDDVTYNDTGWDSRVYSVNDSEFFFKFPRSEKISHRYSQEIAALTRASDLGGINIPKVIWQHPQNEYFGYKGVPGQILEKVIGQLGDSEIKLIGGKLGNFLKRFHTLHVPGERAKLVEDEVAQFQEWYRPAESVLSQAYTKAEKAKLDSLVHRIWPAKLHELGRNPGLCHGDLHLKNMLYDEHEGLGVIDFGDVAQYDISKDFIDLENTVFEAAVLEAYGADELLLQKIAIRKAAIRIVSLTYHIKKNNESDIAKYLQAIRKTL